MMKDRALDDPVLRFEDLSFAYPSTPPILEGLSAQLNPAEICCVIGASGCGKTSLLNLAGGFLFPQSGKISDDSGLVRGPLPSRIMVFQDGSQLFPWLTVRENILFPLKKGLRFDREAGERVDRLIELVGLNDSSGTYPMRLSGGMKQRAVIARALAARPEILLLDEPFTALDAPTRRGLQNTLLELNRELGVSMLFVTHDIREAVYLSDRILLLKAGKSEVLKVELPRGVGLRDEFSDEFVKIERQVYQSISPDRY